MSRINILPADTYLVTNKTIFNSNDQKILTMLYQPIIGSTPINLYLTLWANLDKTEIMSVEFTHHHLMTSMQLKLDEIVEARRKLEAVGLMKTYLKAGEINNYVYQLYSPLSAAEFLTHPLLSILLYNHLGKKDYDRVVDFYKIPKINVNDFEDITTHFSDIFNTAPSNMQDCIMEELKQKQNSPIQIDLEIDFNLISSSLSRGSYNDKTFDKMTKELIKNLSFLYKIDTLHMVNIISSCLNEKGSVDKLKLRTSCRNYYQFENDNQLPGLIYHSQPEHLKTKEIDNSKRAKMIYTFENLSPYDFLRAKYNGGTPTSRDIKLIESLMIEQALNPGVVNVLIDYVLKINGNKLSKNFVETIAGQWKRLNIMRVEEAMQQAEKEHKKYKKAIPVEDNKKKHNPVVPEWFDKEIESKQLSQDKEEKLKSILDKYS